MKEAIVFRLGDGKCICEDCWEREFFVPPPSCGWVAGKCDFCEEEDDERDG